MAMIENSFIVPVIPPEISYASGVLPGLTNFRVKRSKGSTFDEVPVPTEDSFIVEDLRAGGPHLCEAPCTSIHPVPGQCQANNGLLRNRVLLDSIIRMVPDFQAMRILGRVQSPEPPQQPRWTLIIVARRSMEAGNRVDLARMISALLTHNGIQGVAVELVDDRYLMIPRHFEFLELLPHDPVSAVWGQVYESIFRAIGPTGVLSIGCYRVRTPWTRDDEPVNVVVDVDQDARRSWKPVREAIISALDEGGLHHVGVLIKRVTEVVDLSWGGYPSRISAPGTLAGQDQTWSPY